jgi:hypothetical protein
MLRYPIFLADIDAALGKGTATMETAVGASSGTIPVQVF